MAAFMYALYLLCAAASLFCATLLWVSYRQRKVRLLLWSSLCFLGLAVENVLLYIDKATPPTIDLSMHRLLVGLAAIAVLVYGLVLED